MNSVMPLGRGIRGAIVATFLLGAGVVLNAGAPPQGAGPFSSGGGASQARMTVLLFDANSLSLNDARFVIDEVVRWVDTQSDAQLTAVVTTGTKLNVVTDFISDRAALTAVLRSDAFLATIVAPSPGQQAIRFGADPTSRAAVQDPAAQADASPELAEARLGGIATMCQTIEAIQQRKAILYFTAGMQSAPSNGSTLRLVTNACNRANASIYPINIRGLRSATGAPRQ